MYKKNIKTEIEEIKTVRDVVKKIPKNEDYFIISQIYQCDPAAIGEENLESFDSTCSLFTERGITRNNVNQNLNNLSLLNMPNGGLNIDKYIKKLLESSNKNILFINLNNALIKLLQNGIVPLNKLNYNHYDIKAGNILFSTDGHARLIDWGLSSSNDGKTIPEKRRNRAIAFNMPYSDIFFNDYIKQWLPEEIRKIKASSRFRDKKEGQSELLKVVAVNLINKTIEETDEGHYEVIVHYILHDIYKLYASRNKLNVLDYNVLVYNVLIEYIQAVLMKYMDDNGKFDEMGYFYDVFVHNADIWGFLMAYVPFIEEGVGKLHKDIINGVCRILLRYCFSPEFAVKPIDANELALDLSSLTSIAKSIHTSKVPDFTVNRVDSM